MKIKSCQLRFFIMGRTVFLGAVLFWIFGLVPWLGTNSALGQETGIISTVAGGGLGSGQGTTVAQIPDDVAVHGSFIYIADSTYNVVRRLDMITGNEVVVAGNGNKGYSSDGGLAADAQLYAPKGVAVDKEGNLYIADYSNHRIRKVNTNGIISTVAGNGNKGYYGDGGLAINAQLYFPYGVAVDEIGNIYIADNNNSRVRKIETNGIISTVAGNGDKDYSGDGEQATDAQLNCPYGVAVDGAGNIYIADRFNSRIRKVDINGIISTVAGNGNWGYSGDGGQAINARLSSPYGVTVDEEGNIYIADRGNNCIRKVDSNGIISTVAGNGNWGYYGDGGQATFAKLKLPNGVAIDGVGNLYIADGDNNRIRKVDTNGIISTVAGNGTEHYFGDGGQATDAQISRSNGVAIDGSGNIYIADGDNHCIRKVDQNGIISTVVGNGLEGYSGDNGLAANARLDKPEDVAVDEAGNIYIVDKDRYCIRKVDTNGIISTIAGGTWGSSGDGGSATDAELQSPSGVAVDYDGNIYIADTISNRIRMVDTNGIINTVAGTGDYDYFGDGGPATDGKLANPKGVAVDTWGNLYIADTKNNCIRRVDPNGIISTVAGNGNAGYFGDNGLATDAELNSPSRVIIDEVGNLYIADTGNNCIRRVDINGIISTVSGIGAEGYSGDDGFAVNARLSSPSGVAIDGLENLYIADTGNYRIRKTVMNHHAPLGIITTTLPSTKQGQDYNANLIAAGGTEPYNWSIANGALPDGLSLDSDTGHISGIPTESGIFTLIMQVTDGANPDNNSSLKTLTLKVHAEINSIGYWENDSSINDVAANDSYIYAISDENLYVLDASDSSHPSQIGFFNSGGSEIVLSGYYAIISKGETLTILNVSDPNNIFQEGEYQATGYENIPWSITGDPFIKAISVQGNIVYGIKIVNCGEGTDPYLIIVDISDPKNPQKISSIYVGSYAQWSKADDLEVQGDYVYIVDSYDMGLTIVNISNLENPVFSQFFVDVGMGGNDKICIRGSYAYMYDVDKQMVAIIDISDISDTNNIEKISSFKVSEQTIDLLSKGNYVYTIAKDNINYKGLLSVEDITDPINPVEVGYDDTISGLNNISGNEKNYFIAADGGVYIYNYYDSTQLMPEDFNEDGSVDLQDLNVLAVAYGSTDVAKYDLNGDRIVDIYDMVKLSKLIK